MRAILRITLALLALTTVAAAATVDDMVRDLTGPDDLAQARSRQLLPREGLNAAEKVLPLLSSDDARVWWAARNVLTDIANELSAKGREAERARLAKLYMGLVAPEQPEAVKVRGLELLAIAMPRDNEVGPIAVLLEDPNLRERAKATLELIGSPNAARALVDAVPAADPAFQCALLDSVGRCRDGGCLPAVLPLMGHADPKVRAAAARAVAWTGDSGLLGNLRAVRQEADEATRFEATDAVLRLADAMAQAGKARPALQVYAEVMETEADPVLAAAGLSGLIRYGDESVAEQVSTALSGGKRPQFEQTALSEFEYRRGDAGNRLTLAVYAALPPDLRTFVLGSMGRKRDAAFMETLQKASADSNPAIRLAAVNALADARLPGGAAVLEAAAPKEKEAVAALQRMANASRNNGEKAVAGEAFLSLYRVSDAPEVRKAALNELMGNPVPEAMDALLAALDKGELADADPAAIGAMAKVLIDSSRSPEAGRVVELLASRATTTETVQATLDAARAAGGVPGLAQRLGFVTDWRVAGPFAWSPAEAFTVTHVAEPAIDLNATYTENGASITWQPLTADGGSGVADFGGPFGGLSNATAYAFARITVEADTDAEVRAGSDDGIKIWVNGQPVHENAVDRGTALDSDQAPVKLKAGANDILVQITQGGGGWCFCLRLTAPDGAPLKFTQGQ